MRTLSATLTAAQKSGRIDPLVKVVLTQGANSYTYTRTRIMDIDKDEEAFSHRAKIILSNRDGALTALALQGYKAVISAGINTSAGEEYSAQPALYVIGQDFSSVPGDLTCMLTCAGIFDLLGEDRASADYLPDSTNTDTVKTIINAVLGATLGCFNHCTAWTVTWDSEDTLVNTYTPKNALRIYEGQSRLAVIRYLLDYTKNVAKIGNEATPQIHFFVPTTTGATYDYEYSLVSGEHLFFSKSLRQRLVVPNKVTINSLEFAGTAYSASTTDTTSFGLLPFTQFGRSSVADSAQALALATALLSKYQLHAQSGAALVLENVGAEVYDYVNVTDARQGDSRAGNIGSLKHNWNAKKGEWTMSFQFGGWLSRRLSLNGLEGLFDDLDIGPD